jgi:hypothetical protein
MVINIQTAADQKVTHLMVTPVISNTALLQQAKLLLTSIGKAFHFGFLINI